MTNESLHESGHDEEYNFPPPTPQEIIAMQKLKEMHPDLYQNYLEFTRDCRSAIHAVTLSQSSRETLDREQEISENELLLRVVRMNLKNRPDFIRRMSLGYAGARALPNPVEKVLRNTMKRFLPPDML